jgi:AraC-like DNA-binding protein
VRLRGAGRTAEQIAYGVGCRDPTYFGRFFSRRVGMSLGAAAGADVVLVSGAATLRRRVICAR